MTPGFCHFSRESFCSRLQPEANGHHWRGCRRRSAPRVWVLCVFVYIVVCAMMEKYRLVEEYRGEGDEFLEEQSSVEEVRITHLGKPKNYISYAMSLFVSEKW